MFTMKNAKHPNEGRIRMIDGPSMKGENSTGENHVGRISFQENFIDRTRMHDEREEGEEDERPNDRFH